LRYDFVRVARIVELELAGQPALARDLVAGGVFVPGVTLAMGEDIELLLRGAAGELRVRATCVWVNGAQGSGLQLTGCDADMKQRISALAAAADAPAYEPAEESAEATTEESAELPTESPAEEDDDRGQADKKLPANVHERLRGLTLAQQIKIAHHGEVSERIVLERLYSKNVWEALLRNPRLTGPEVARIARMGSLPRPLLELVVNNGGWMQIPEVRRALLSNPRLGTDQIIRILRLLPKHELKLAAMQTAYPHAVRDAAKRILKESAGG
jgi:hypothetical protein